MAGYSDEKLRIPAFMRKSELKRREKKKILFTALDRKLAHEKKSIEIKKKEILEERKHRVTISTPVIKKEEYSEPKITYPKTYYFEKDEIIQKNEDLGERVVKLKKIGEITHYFEKINVGIIKLISALKEDDIIIIGNKKQIVDSIQINREPVKIAYKGDDIGIKLKHKAEIGEEVYVIEI